MRRCSIALTLVAVLSAPLPGKTDTSSIPRELALALIGADFRGAPRITIGRLPDGFARGLILANARILGGATYPSDPEAGMTGSVVAIAVITDSAESGVSKLAESLGPAGWTQPPLPNPSAGGFSSGGLGDRGPTILLCNESSSLMLNAKSRAAGGSTLHLSLFPAGRGMCDTDRMDGMGRLDVVSLPTLRPPAGVLSRGGGGGGGNNYRESNTELATSKGASELVDIFSRQLSEQGWMLGLRAADSNTVIQMASRTDEKGNALIGVLGVVAKPGTNTRHVWIRVVRNRSRRSEQ